MLISIDTAVDQPEIKKWNSVKIIKFIYNDYN